MVYGNTNDHGFGEGKITDWSTRYCYLLLGVVDFRTLTFAGNTLIGMAVVI